jgi:DNA topoisomerase IA
MKINTEKKIKPLKKVKALKEKKEQDEQLLKPAVRIQELKNKLIILGHELFVTKKINESLYRKLQLITYSRTTEQKLKDSYKTLKDIDNNIKQSEATQDKPQKSKKKTLKDFKENKKTVDDDRNTLYNIYI